MLHLAACRLITQSYPRRIIVRMSAIPTTTAFCRSLLSLCIMLHAMRSPVATLQYRIRMFSARIAAAVVDIHPTTHAQHKQCHAKTNYLKNILLHATKLQKKIQTHNPSLFLILFSVFLAPYSLLFIPYLQHTINIL